MNENYHPQIIEAECQAYWYKNQTFSQNIDVDQDKFYCLAMFPYPSGKLHMGHVRNYTISDVISRFWRLNGKAVLQPIGWDAFGLPAENAAIKHQVHPKKWTYQNIAQMREQLKALGFAYDWNREIATCDPQYYHWEQWLFVQLFKKGLVYRKETEVNWDPVDHTVLANEQVIDGKGWRSGALVERKKIPQWFFRITDYAQELLEDLDLLTDWPEAVLSMQKHWIGQSKGLEISFKLDSHAKAKTQLDDLIIYTTRPDTLFGVSYLAIAPQHPITAFFPEWEKQIQTITQTGISEAAVATAPKQGFDTGLTVIHPLTGETLPVWVANFVLMGYGSGAVMCVPAHDDRDWEFAQTYDLPIKQVIRPTNNTDMDIHQAAFTDKGILVNSNEFSDLTSEQAFDALADKLAQNNQGRVTINYRLRDWGISRQRYWGTPIPIIYCDSCGPQPVPDVDLPVVLPEDIGNFDLSKGSPLAKMPSFVETHCPSCKQPACRETDTFDTFVESSWYFLRFLDPQNNQMLMDPTKASWLPVDQYVGGIEHAVLHLLYARFFHKLLRDQGIHQSDEPFQKLLCQGMVTAETFYRTEEIKTATGETQTRACYYYPHEIDLLTDSKGQVTQAILKSDNKPVTIGGIEKMSKSKNNGVDPQTMIDQYGADSVRIFIMFASPADQALKWNDDALEGAHRYLKRVWRLVYLHSQEKHTLLDIPANEQLKPYQIDFRRVVHQTLQKVTHDLGVRQAFNTAIAALMTLTNEISGFEIKEALDFSLKHEALHHLIVLLSPFAPHITQNLWQTIKHPDEASDLAKVDWPSVNEAALANANIQLIIQVGGKLRGKIDLPEGLSEDETIHQAQSHPNVLKFIEGQNIKKVICIPNKLVNFVL